MQDPLKQGLKHAIFFSITLHSSIRMQDPLKQGLKHIEQGSEYIPDFLIRMQDPLKQGLKPKF